MGTRGPAFSRERSNHRRIRAFTLIELLIVIAIIAILAGMLLPALSIARAKGRSAKCVGQLKQVALGFSMYVNDSEEFFPALSYGENNGTLYTNALANGNYVEINGWHDELDGDVRIGMWRCPEVDDSHYQGGVGCGGGYGVNESHVILPDKNLKVTDVARPLDIFLIGDVMDVDGGTICTEDAFECPIETPWPENANDTSVADVGRCAPRHNRRVDMAFIDGHVETREYHVLRANEKDIFAHDSY